MQQTTAWVRRSCFWISSTTREVPLDNPRDHPAHHRVRRRHPHPLDTRGHPAGDRPHPCRPGDARACSGRSSALLLRRRRRPVHGLVVVAPQMRSDASGVPRADLAFRWPAGTGRSPPSSRPSSCNRGVQAAAVTRRRLIRTDLGTQPAATRTTPAIRSQRTTTPVTIHLAMTWRSWLRCERPLRR